MRISDWSSDVCSSDLYFSKADTGFRNAFVAIGQRIAHQVAGIRESPGMVGADKRFAIAFLIGAKLIAPVRTLVQKKPDIPFPIADHDDGRGTHAFGHVVVLFRNFTFVTDIVRSEEHTTELQ